MQAPPRDREKQPHGSDQPQPHARTRPRSRRPGRSLDKSASSSTSTPRSVAPVKTRWILATAPIHFVHTPSLTADIETQIGEAVRSADLILFCVDAQAGVTPQDEVIATMLREGKLGGNAKRRKGGEARGDERRMPPIRIVATKVDGPRWEA